MKFNLFILSLVTLPLLSGCITMTAPTNAYIHNETINGQKAIEVELVNVTLSLTLTDHKLSALQSSEIRHFISQQGSSYKQRILVSGSQDNLIRYLPQLSQLLIEQGINQYKQRFQPTSNIAKNQLVFISEYFQAIAPGCNDDLIADLGCANSRNLAMMIADPAQLLRAAPRAPTDANKAVSAIKAYRAGEPMQSSSLSGFGKDEQ